MEATQRRPRTLHLYNPAEDLEALATEYKAYQRQIESLKALAEAAKSAMIDAMGGQEIAIAGVYKITNKVITSNRLDTDALKAALPKVYAKYTKQSTSTRFEIR